jgi:capsular exopolysaccharide synthesis family protein
MRLKTIPVESIPESWAVDDCSRPPAPITDIRRIIRVLYRRRWIVAGLTAACLLGAILYLRMSTPLYQARVKLLIEPENPNVVTFKEVVDENTAKLDYYQTQLGILRSRTLARRTLDAVKLWDRPEFAAAPGGWRALAGGSFAALGLGTGPDVHLNETTVQSRAIDRFLARLTLSYRADNRLLDIGFELPDARLATTVANSFAEAYIDQNRELRLRASREASDWLNARLAEQRREVEATETALQRYREANADVSLVEQQNVATQKLADLSSAATRARMERIDAESQYRRLEAVQGNPAASGTLPLVLSNTVVQQLKSELATLQREQTTLAEKFGDKHPDVRRVNAAVDRVQEQLRQEVSTITESVHNQMLAAQTKERSLIGALEDQKRQALELNRRTIQYDVLQREATGSRQMFESLLQRAKETQLSSELNTSNIRIVDPAEVPLSPAWPRTSVILLLALMLGVPLGMGTALAAEYFDDRLTSPEDIKEALGIRCLGIAPAVRRKPGELELLALDEQASPHFSEAVQTVRANLVLSGGRSLRSVLVMSARPDEGKTTTAVSLAVSLARTGRRVLLIDGDLRRSRLHTIFDQPLEPGLSDVLRGTTALHAAIRTSHHDNLSILPAGVASVSPGDLLQVEALSEHLVSHLREFEWVIIDSPPALVAADATSLAQVVSGILFVVGARMTTAQEAKLALEQIAPTGTRVMGAVLSRPDLTMMPDYLTGYGKYYDHRTH